MATSKLPSERLGNLEDLEDSGLSKTRQGSDSGDSGLNKTLQDRDPGDCDFEVATQDHHYQKCDLPGFFSVLGIL